MREAEPRNRHGRAFFDRDEERRGARLGLPPECWMSLSEDSGGMKGNSFFFVEIKRLTSVVKWVPLGRENVEEWNFFLLLFTM